MNLKNCLMLLLLSTPLAAVGQQTKLWMRYPALSPDGSTIAFSYQGDIYTVPSSGGAAKRLTSHEAIDTRPIWSPDGSQIAFVSDRREGANDIYIMSAQGGTARQITTHSTTEIPQFFSHDGQTIYYTAHIQDLASSALYPTDRVNELYQVSTLGGRSTHAMATPIAHGTLSPDGKYIYYEDQKSFENEWRKHQTSSVARNILRYDIQKGTHTPIITHPAENRSPRLSADGKTLYFLSERDGSFNVYSAQADGSGAKALTHFKEHPVRFLTIARTGLLAFAYDGGIYTLQPGAKPRRVDIQIHSDHDLNTIERRRLTSGITYTDISPDGKQIAFVIRGEVFVTSADYSTTRRITDTPAAEGNVTFADDRTLVYTSKRDGRSDLYVATIDRDDDPNFPNATLITEKLLIPGLKGEKTVPQFAPNGKDIAFLFNRKELMVYNIDSKKWHRVSDGRYKNDRTGGFNYVWSPDSKWLALSVVTNHHEPYSDIAIVNAQETDGTITNITQSGYFAENPRFVMGGNAIIYSSEQFGMRNHASWGSMSDVMIVFLNREAYDKYRLSKEDYELLTDAEKKAKAEEKKEDKKEDSKPKEETITVELQGIEHRIVRLTTASSDLGDAYITKDGKSLYYLAAFEGGYDLWKKELRSGNVELLKKLDGPSYALTPDRKETKLLLSSSGDMKLMNLSSEKISGVTFRAEMNLRPYAERQFMFDEVRREEADRFYVKDMHGVNWARLTAEYEAFLPSISNNADFSEMLSELLGELNVSHTGSGYRSTNSAPRTAELGLFLDFTPNPKGMRIDEVVAGGPFDTHTSKVRAGHYLTAIDGTRIDPNTDLFPLLAGKAGVYTLVTISDGKGSEWSERVKPISAGRLSSLLYRRWTEARAAEVDRLSGGKLGYVHISSMNDNSFRGAYADLLGKYYQRQGVVVDIRYNGGGRLHEDIEVLLSGTKYLTQEIQGQYYCDMPSRRWTKPSVMVTCEMDYSNAHGTPWVYQKMKIGKVVGMPVPGTMTSVNWVTLQDPSVYFGIPAVGYKTAEGYYLENHQLEPDVVAPLDMVKVLKGHDTQMEAAVRELMK